MISAQDDEAEDANCRKSIQHIVALLTDPNSAPPEGLRQVRPPGGRSPIEVVVPAHLQDLKEGDLPEEQRVAVLDQISIFRENAARREREKKAVEDERERFKKMEQRQGPTSPSTSRAQPSSNYGYGNRVLGRDTPQVERQRQWGQSQNNHPNQDQSPRQPRESPREDGGDDGWRASRDPQGYDKPVNFVKAQQTEAKGESERTDEEEEEMRKQRRDRERDLALRDVSCNQCSRLVLAAADIPLSDYRESEKWRTESDTESRDLIGNWRTENNRLISRSGIGGAWRNCSRIGMTTRSWKRVETGSMPIGRLRLLCRARFRFKAH